MNFRRYKNVRKIGEIRKILELNPGHIEFHAKQSKLLHNKSLLTPKDWYDKRQATIEWAI